MEAAERIVLVSESRSNRSGDATTGFTTIYEIVRKDVNAVSILVDMFVPFSR